MAAIQLGTIKGILGLSTNTVTGLVIHSIDFKSTNEKHEFYNTDGDVTSTGHDDFRTSVSIKGELLQGTAMTATVASALTLTTIPDHMPSGYGGGMVIVDEIGISEAIREYQMADISATIYPKVS